MPLSSPGQVTIEKTSGYFVTKEAPERIHAINPKIKLIVVVRNPFERALSDYAQVSSKREMPPFERLAFRRHPVSGRVGININYNAIRLGTYVRYLRRWLAKFPIEQFIFVDGDTLKSAPAETTNQVEQFLGLTQYVTSDNFVNDTQKGLPCLIRKDRPSPKCLGKTKGRVHPTLVPGFANVLRTFYEPFNEIFFRMINKRFNCVYR